VQLVSVRLAAVGAMAPLAVRDRTAPAGTDAIKGERAVWFAGAGAMTARVYDRRRMPARLAAPGPAVIESLESTILVPPDWRARMDDDGFVVLTRRASERE
jgi:N-methylhydantoinase A